MLVVEHLSVQYGRIRAVREISLRVDAGEIVGLLGPNGAGKTTTLFTAAGLLAPIGGEALVFGRSVKGRKPQHVARDGMALVPEDRSLFFQLTVKENLRLGAKPGAPIEPVFEYFPKLEELLDRRAGLLSGGEQQMLAVGRALLTQPKLLMVDEMSLGLAPVIVQALLPVLRQVADDRGCGILLVEQHVQLALEIADHAYVLAHGDLVLESPAEALRHDRSILESSYLGDRVLPA